MKASLALVLVLVLILGITIPCGVTATAVSGPASLRDEIKNILDNFKPCLEEAASKIKIILDNLKPCLEETASKIKQLLAEKLNVLLNQLLLK